MIFVRIMSILYLKYDEGVEGNKSNMFLFVECVIDLELEDKIRLYLILDLGLF